MKCSRVLCMRVNYITFYTVIAVQMFAFKLVFFLTRTKLFLGKLRPVIRDHHSRCQGHIFTYEQGRVFYTLNAEKLMLY
jgi:hypothetical protein